MSDYARGSLIIAIFTIILSPAFGIYLAAIGHVFLAVGCATGITVIGLWVLLYQVLLPIVDEAEAWRAAHFYSEGDTL